MGHSKRYQACAEKVDYEKQYALDEAVKIVKENCLAKFDETVELAVNLGINPRHADQQVRGTVVLPNGTGKKMRVVVFAQGENVKLAQDAGADYVGGEELAEKIQNENWLDFDVAIATPDMMRVVGKLGRLLGPRGLMPNPKAGTVTNDIAKTVEEFKAGKIEYRCDRSGVVHAPVGKASFGEQQLVENIKELVRTLVRVKPASAKGTYLQAMYVSSTMGPSVRLDTAEVKSY
jgi:large subunit ribosomal protein L1